MRGDDSNPNHDRPNNIPPNIGEEQRDDGDARERGEHRPVVELGAEDPERLGGAREVEEEPVGAGWYKNNTAQNNMATRNNNDSKYYNALVRSNPRCVTGSASL